MNTKMHVVVKGEVQSIPIIIKDSRLDTQTSKLDMQILFEDFDIVKAADGIYVSATRFKIRFCYSDSNFIDLFIEPGFFSNGVTWFLDTEATAKAAIIHDVLTYVVFDYTSTTIDVVTEIFIRACKFFSVARPFYVSFKAILDSVDGDCFTDWTNKNDSKLAEIVSSFLTIDFTNFGGLDE